MHELSFLGGIPTDTKSALSYISTIFPSEKFNNRLPPIVMRHQIYAFVKNRTQVDRELVRYAIKISYLYSEIPKFHVYFPIFININLLNLTNK